MTTTERPNIVWYLSEDNNPYIGAYGDPVARTPRLDAFAREGVLYEVAYSTAPVCAPARFSFLTGVCAESVGPAHHMRAWAQLPEFMRGFPADLRDAGYYTTNNHKTDYNAEVSCSEHWSESSGQAHWRNRPPGVPFFSQFTDLTTHESCQFHHAGGDTRPDDVRVPSYLPDTPVVRADIANYYDRMHDMDAKFGQLLDDLEQDGLAEDTIVFYFGDNGGSLPFSKRFCNDAGLRIPLLVRIPPKYAHLAPVPPGGRVSSPIDGTDFAATALALAGLPAPEHMHGRPFLGDETTPRRHIFGQRGRMDSVMDMQRAVRDEQHLYIRNYRPHRPYGQYQAFAWQQRSYQEWEQLHLDGELDEVQDRFWREKPKEELYDVVDDPDCVRNLVAAADRGGVLDELRRILDDHLVDTWDNGFIPESHPAEGYDASRRPGTYPLREVLAIAHLAIERDGSHLPRLVDALAHDNDIVRYWAAQGVVMLDAVGAPAVPALERALEHDPSVYVRIPAAEALAKLVEPKEAVAFLTETVASHPLGPVRVQAVDALTWIGDAARPARDALAVVAETATADLRRAAGYLVQRIDGTYTPQSMLFEMRAEDFDLESVMLTCHD